VTGERYRYAARGRGSSSERGETRRRFKPALKLRPLDHMDIDRRLHAKRASIARRVVNEIVHKRGAVVTIEGLRDCLDIPADAAARIIRNLVRAGLFAEVRSGVWMNVVLA